MFKIVDDFLNGITMYRLVLCILILLLLIAISLSSLGFLPFNPVLVVCSAAFITAVCWITNKIFAKTFKAPTNLESVYITALILALIITPVSRLQDFLFLSLIAVLAVASKYILIIGKKHFLNPAALGAAISLVFFNMGASWWVGNIWMIPFVTIGGFLVIRKIQKGSMILSFLLVSLVVILTPAVLRGNDLFSITQKVILESPIFFFAFVMLTEPQTTPPTKILQTIYGVMVGLFTISAVPEIALLAGNIFSYLVSPKQKLILSLKEKTQIAPDVYDFVFSLDRKLAFIPGQYMEWTLSHLHPDNRGNRRYFTIASSPTENNLRIGVKFYPESSSFKKTLLSLNSNQRIAASQLSGEFVLPKDITRKICFIAGGIGITPYRSMIKYLIDTDQKRDIILLYSNKLASDIVYKDIFSEAFTKLGIETVYVLTDKTNIPQGWGGKVGYKVGYIDSKVIQEEVPDYKSRIYYISGPHSMVDAFEKTLKDMGINGKQIKVDYFPGYA